MTVWKLQGRINRQLLIWSAFSVAIGVALLFAAPFWRGVGVQALVWGAIDAGIAGVGLLALRRKLKRQDADHPDVRSKETRNLRRLLLINAGLDVLYIVAGGVVLYTFTTDFARGNGVGIIIQGGFLLLFDTFYAYRVGRVGAKVQA